jgi:hypothetical protein
MIDNLRERAEEFDVLHFHIDLFHFPLFRSLASRTLTTLHGRQDLGDLGTFYSRFREMPLVSISDDQRKPLPHAKFMTTIHHGIPADLHRPSFENGKYLAFLGRISPDKRPDRAIRIARAAGMPLKIAAKVDKVDEDYFRSEILPLIDGPGVEFVGEINEREKTKFLGEAAALLFPVDWPEPFGLVMIEAMACGTPVLAFRCGSIPEVIEDGVTGKVVDSEEEAVAALPGILSYDRRAVRQRFEERFTATRMAKDYVSTYRQLLSMRTSDRRRRSPWLRRSGLNGGNGSIPVSPKRPFPLLAQPGANFAVDPIRMRARAQTINRNPLRGPVQRRDVHGPRAAARIVLRLQATAWLWVDALPRRLLATGLGQRDAVHTA